MLKYPMAPPPFGLIALYPWEADVVLAATVNKKTQFGQATGDEERRQRLLSIDAARVVERELAGEKEKRKAADALVRTLEKYLEEEKARAAVLQTALSEAQRQPVLLAAEPAKSSQPRLKPSRRAAPAAAPVRRKTLR